ncbi:hypothetical protein BV20DRAFT_147232 [Pilatotrama ljubarskyi]|nr:hypothetical protein BV20DRAFT_147232 [Pilatotrama ljubarskyi]
MLTACSTAWRVIIAAQIFFHSRCRTAHGKEQLLGSCAMQLNGPCYVASSGQNNADAGLCRTIHHFHGSEVSSTVLHSNTVTYHAPRGHDCRANHPCPPWCNIARQRDFSSEEETSERNSLLTCRDRRE